MYNYGFVSRFVKEGITNKKQLSDLSWQFSVTIKSRTDNRQLTTENYF